jgi:hypothetical protein
MVSTRYARPAARGAMEAARRGRSQRGQFEIFVAKLAVRSAFFRSFSLHVHVGCRPRQRVTNPYLSVGVAFPFAKLPLLVRIAASRVLPLLP